MSQPQVEFQRSPTRCPYCHEDCREADAIAVCRACLAPHHATCWGELGRCGGCGSSAALTHELSGTGEDPTGAGLARALGRVAGLSWRWLLRPREAWKRTVRMRTLAVAAESPARQRFVGAFQFALLVLVVALATAFVVALSEGASSVAAVVFGLLVPGLPVTWLFLATVVWLAAGATVRLGSGQSAPTNAAPELPEDAEKPGQVKRTKA